MKKNIDKINSLNSVSAYFETANSFERIAKAETDKWLPYYYAAMLLTLTSYADTTAEKKDIYLDKADMLILTADSLSPDNSEIYALRGMIAQARLQIDPMNRWMKYGAQSSAHFNKSVSLDSLNPRPDYLIGMNIYHTPEQFGGGKAAALPYLESALKKYDAFVPENELMPSWGREAVESLVAGIKNKDN
jgi:hypothetical protein